MYKHTFSCATQSTDHHSATTISCTIDGDASLPEMLDAFQYYLLANGYVFDGDLCIVVEENEATKN